MHMQVTEWQIEWVKEEGEWSHVINFGIDKPLSLVLTES